MGRFSSLKGRAFVLLMMLWFLWFINFSVRVVFPPIMPLIEDEFIISHVKASSLFALTSFGYGVSLLLSGFFAGLFGYKRSIILSLVISTCVLFSIPFVKLFSYLSISAFIIGFSTGIYLPAIIPLITNYFDEKIWGKTIAIHDTAASVSIFSMPFIVLFFLKFLEWREIFYIFGGVFILCIILFYLFSNEVRVEKTHENLFVNLVKEKSLWIMFIIWMFSTGANFGIYSIIPLYLTKELGIEMGYANKVFGLSRLGGVLVAIMTGFIVDRFSLKKTLFSMMLTTGFLTIIIAHKDVRLIQIILFFQAAFASGFFPVGLVAISRIFRSEQRSMATGFIVTASVIFGGGIIPYGLGLTGDLISFRLGIFLLGILVIIASTFTFLLKSLK